MKRTFALALLTTIIISACVPVSAPTSTPATAVGFLPSDTPRPTATLTNTPAPTATPTIAPTSTPTPIPTLPPEQVGGLTGIPDPRYSNPELFDLSNPDAPIPKFINAMRMAGVDVNANEVLQTLAKPENFRVCKDINGNFYVVDVYSLTGIGRVPYTIALIWDDRLGWRETTLKDWGEKSGIRMGVYIEPNESFWTNQKVYQRLVGQHFDTLVIPYFWHVVFPNRDESDFDLPNTYLRIAASNKMLPFPAAFVWQNTKFLPRWFIEGQSVRSDFVSLIEKTVSHIPVDAQIIEVVNEPYAGDFLSQSVGEDYIQLAFNTVRMNRPDAHLLLNHFGILKGEANFTYTAELVERLKQEELIDGIGIQLHIDENTRFSYDLLIQSFDYWAKATHVNVTEVSVDIGEPEVRAQAYYDIVRAALVEHVEGIVFWGVGSAAWKGANSTLFDNDLAPNTSFYAVNSAFTETQFINCRNASK